MKLNFVKQLLNLEIIDILSVGFIDRDKNSTQYVKILNQILLKTKLGYTQIKQVDKPDGVYLQFKTKKTLYFDFEIDEEDEFCCSSISHLLLGSYLSGFVVRDLIIYGNYRAENNSLLCEAIEIDCIAEKLNKKFFIDSYDLDGLVMGNYTSQDWIDNRNYLNKSLGSRSILN